MGKDQQDYVTSKAVDFDWKDPDMTNLGHAKELTKDLRGILSF